MLWLRSASSQTHRSCAIASQACSMCCKAVNCTTEATRRRHEGCRSQSNVRLSIDTAIKTRKAKRPGKAGLVILLKGLEKSRVSASCTWRGNCSMKDTHLHDELTATTAEANPSLWSLRVQGKQ